ncbi:MAG: RNA-binding S4 domain-containing protein [Bacteroidota bacterium]
MEEFQINGEFIQLIQALKAIGWVGSGGEAKMVVDEGMVEVNGQTELQKRKKLRPGDRVEFEGQILKIV